MKTELRNFLMGAGLTVLLWTPCLKADDSLAVAKIPFDFQVDKTSLPAGTYTVIAASNSVAIRLRNDSTGKCIAVLPTARETSTTKPRLSFRRHGDHYFLSGVWTAGSPGYILHKGSLEREMEVGGAAIAAVAYVPMANR